MKIRIPDKDRVFRFIVETHQVEKINLTFDDVNKTAMKKSKNPYAFGHLWAFTKLTQIMEKPDWPCRSIEDTKIRIKSEPALAWMRELHTMCFGEVKTLLDMAQDPNAPKELGRWRTTPALNTETAAPPPGLIPAIMRNWLYTVRTYEDQFRKGIDSNTLDRQSSQKITAFIKEQPLFFSIVQPFQYGNNRFGRLMENGIRLYFNLPIRDDITNYYPKFLDELYMYQKDRLPEIIREAKTLERF